MFKRFAIALSVAFLFAGSGFWVSPAAADWVVGIGNVTDSCVQFDWRGGTATYSGSGDGVFTVDVNNTIDNTIGGGSTADSWSIWVNDVQVVQSSVVEQSQVSVSVAGDWVVTVQGVDVGFWAGWYGPQFCTPIFTPFTLPISQPEVTPVYIPAAIPTGDFRIDEGQGGHVVSPEGMMIDRVQAWYGDPNDGNYGADWSEQYTQQLHGLVEADLNSGNYFGDPVPGVYKVLIATVFFVADPAFVAPVVVPSIEPSVEPSVEPASDPVPVVEPEPVVVSSSEVRPEEPPVQEVVMNPVPDPAPIDVRPSEPPVQVVVPEPVAPTPEPLPTIEPAPSPTVEPSPSESPSTAPQPTPEPVGTTSSEPIPVVTDSPQPEPVVPPIKSSSSSEPPAIEPSNDVSNIATNKPNTESIPVAIEAPKPVTPPIELTQTPSPTHEQELQQLMDEAKQDDVVVPAEIAAIPFIGGAAVALVDTFNALGNVGADMTPKVRATAKKEVVAAVIVGQVAQTAAAVAGSASSVRRRNS